MELTRSLRTSSQDHAAGASIYTGYRLPRVVLLLVIIVRVCTDSHLRLTDKIAAVLRVDPVPPPFHPTTLAQIETILSQLPLSDWSQLFTRWLNVVPGDWRSFILERPPDFWYNLVHLFPDLNIKVSQKGPAATVARRTKADLRGWATAALWFLDDLSASKDPTWIASAMKKGFSTSPLNNLDHFQTPSISSRLTSVFLETMENSLFGESEQKDPYSLECYANMLSFFLDPIGSLTGTTADNSSYAQLQCTSLSLLRMSPELFPEALAFTSPEFWLSLQALLMERDFEGQLFLSGGSIVPLYSVAYVSQLLDDVGLDYSLSGRPSSMAYRTIIRQEWTKLTSLTRLASFSSLMQIMQDALLSCSKVTSARAVNTEA